MPTGFMPAIIALCLLLAARPAAAQDIALIGIIGDRAAVIAIDGGDPKTIKVGDTWRGISVVSIDKAKDEATFEIKGQRRVMRRGAHHRSASAKPFTGRQSAILSADSRGHFVAEGSVNGAHMRMLVDTGATAVALPATDAQRLGLDYRKGQRVSMQTANGTAPAYVITLERVKVGDIELYGVQAVVVEGGLHMPLLGMTFLNRVEMRREGEFMTLNRLF